jgi:3-oxoacyl-[acyl-carrier protein] reductase
MTRVVIVTGAASGVGAAVCRALAGPDVGVVIHTRRNEAGAEAVAASVRAAGGEAVVLLGDLVEPATARTVVETAVARFGQLDVLISNAGFADRTAIAALTDAAMTQSVEAIQGAFVRLTRAAIPHLRTARDPRVVAVSSFVAHVFRPGVATFPASAAAKAGLESLVKALAIELASAGVTVNGVIPGFIRKDPGAHAAVDPARLAQQVAAVPLGRIGLPEEVAAAVAFLASPAAGYITGAMLRADGGLAM